MIPSALVTWSPYAGASKVILALVLVLIALGLFIQGRKMTREIKLPKISKVVLAVVIVIWAFSILTFHEINVDIARYTGSAGNLGPILPITIVSAICTFIFVAYVSRRDGAIAALGRGFLGFVAGPMVFEFPFLLIVIPRTKAPLVPALIFLIPLFTIIFTTLSMLLYSRKVAITKFTLYCLGAMIFAFAIWALEGYSYPSNPVSFVFNAISKVLAFATVGAMFVTKDEGVSTAELKIGEDKTESNPSN